MRTPDGLILSGACLILVAALHLAAGAAPAAGDLAAMGLAGLACGALAPLRDTTRLDLLFLGSCLVCVGAAYAALGTEPTVAGLTVAGLAGLGGGAVLLVADARSHQPVLAGAAIAAAGRSAGRRPLVLLRRVSGAVLAAGWDARRLRMYLSGCVLFSVGVKLFIDSGLGVDPLHSMVIGIVQALDLPYVGVGLVASAVTAAFLLLWSLWNRRLPPPATFLTMALVGYLVDLWNRVGLEPLPEGLLTPTSAMLAGLLVEAYASALIIMSGVGIRVMDLVTITMMRRWGCSFVAGKVTLELGFLSAALVLHGPIGAGTVGFILVVAPFVTPFMRANERLLGLPNFGLGGGGNGTGGPSAAASA